jgi:hypothetical protein
VGQSQITPVQIIFGMAAVALTTFGIVVVIRNVRYATEAETQFVIMVASNAEFLTRFNEYVGEIPE